MPGTKGMESFVVVPENLSDRMLLEIQDLINEGNAMYFEGHHQQAYDLFTNAIRQATCCFKSITEISNGGKMLLSNLYNRRAAAANKLENYPQVLSDAQEMVAIGFQILKAYVRMGGALLQLGRPAEAREAYKKALSLAPGNEAYTQYLALAEQACEKAGLNSSSSTPVPQVSDSARLLEKIHSSYKKGNKVFFAERPNYIEALSHYNSAIEDTSKLVETDTAAVAQQHALLARRAQTLQRLERFKETIADADKMIALAPSCEKGYLHKATAYTCLAQHTLETALRKISDPQVRKVLQEKLSRLEEIMS
jgi:tetratricopeptide (TPR) repeat protein